MKTRRGFLQTVAALVAGLFCPKPAPPKQIVSAAILTPGESEAAGIGVSIRFIQRYDVPTNRIVTRMDVMSGWRPVGDASVALLRNTINPEYKCRIAS